LNSDNKFSARQQNLKTILTLLDENTELSAKQLANLTGLSIVSVNKLLDILKSNSDIIATNFLNTRGRRAKIYHLNYDAYQLGIIKLVENNKQIQATYFLTNLAGTINYKKTNDQKITSIEQLTDFIKTETTSIKPQKIIVGVPGAELDGYLQVMDVKSLRGINLSSAIQTATGINTLVINDANASTFGAASELNESNNIAVGIYFPKNFGPGIGIVINNQLVNGADGLAGEIEYSTMEKGLAIPEQIRKLVQNIISFLNPNLIIIYADKMALTNLQIDQIKQTLHHNLPLHDKYRLNFDRDFEQDYLLGLATIGRKNLLKALSDI